MPSACWTTTTFPRQPDQVLTTTVPLATAGIGVPLPCGKSTPRCGLVRPQQVEPQPSARFGFGKGS
jgi:hypothetical protein